MGDGTLLSGVAVDHGFAAAGTYTVTLTVMDTSGFASTVQLQIDITGPKYWWRPALVSPT
jgi:hypothetical protein